MLTFMPHQNVLLKVQIQPPPWVQHEVGSFPFSHLRYKAIKLKCQLHYWRFERESN